MTRLASMAALLAGADYLEFGIDAQAARNFVGCDLDALYSADRWGGRGLVRFNIE